MLTAASPLPDLVACLRASLAAAVDRVGPVGSAIVAVSGGPDSLALMLGCAEWRRSAGDGARAGAPRFIVVTVDHRLRPESAAEAAHVAMLAREAGLPHETLVWHHGAVRGNLSGEARRARYERLAEAARRHGAAVILTAHHHDDQLETFIMARRRRAGIAGAAGMRPVREIAPGMALVRPFLGLERGRLVAAVEAAGWRAVDDPTNRDMHYERVAVRRALAAGDPDREATARDLAAAGLRREAVEGRLAGAIRGMRESGDLVPASDGTLRLTRSVFGGPDRELSFLLLQRLVAAVSGADQPPAGAGIRRLLDGLAGGGGRVAATLGGAALEARDVLLLFREYGRGGAAAVAVPPGEGDVLFDGRFDIEPAGFADGAKLTVIALGALGRGGRIGRTLPVLLRDGEAVAAHPAIAGEIGGPAAELALRCRVEWRLVRDLPTPQAAPPVSAGSGG